MWHSNIILYQNTSYDITYPGFIADAIATFNVFKNYILSGVTQMLEVSKWNDTTCTSTTYINL